MTADAVERGFALGMAIDAKAHVDFINRHDAIHRLDRSVTALALDSGVDMRVMRFHWISNGGCVSSVHGRVTGSIPPLAIPLPWHPTHRATAGTPGSDDRAA